MVDAEQDGRAVDVPAAVGAMAPAAMTALVRRASGRPDVEATSWECHLLHASPRARVTVGVYRVAGVAPGPGRAAPWSVVLKVIRRTARDHPPASPDYWKREAPAYGSGLLAALTAGLAAPRCAAVREGPGDTAWLWLEDVADVYRQQGLPWPMPERFLLAARHLGRFNGAPLAGAPLPAHPWLSRGDARWWVETTGPRALELVRRPGTWADPNVRRVFPEPVADRLLRLWDEREALLAALDALPQTLCHRDPLVPLNLFARRRPDGTDGEEETVAIDWAVVGIGPVGEDLAHLLEGSRLRVLLREAGRPDGPAAAQALREAALGAYLAGLEDAGWRGDPRRVRFGVLLSGVLQRTFRGARWALECALADPPDLDEAERSATATSLRLRHLEEVRELLPG